MSIEIERAVLEKACKEMIETIFLCLPNAAKGTIYRIGKPPDLLAERITSGIIDQDRKVISWGLPAKSEYNHPGKPWIEYRDEPGRPLEAMSWCVESQKSWTAEDPGNDARSIRLQKKLGGREDFHHMEPVLVRKSDLSLDVFSSFEFPRDYKGNIIWKDNDYIVVAVIKIHFDPYSIKIGGTETRVIKKLSRSLGTELLSYQLSRDSLHAMKKLARDRLNACNILSDSLRNAITKFGLIFSLIKQEIGYLRNQWEQILIAERQIKNSKAEGIRNLDKLLMSLNNGSDGLTDDLFDAQKKFLELSLPPEQGENWVVMQIEERWRDLLCKHPVENDKERTIWQTIDQLKTSLHFGKDPDIVEKYKKIPKKLKWDWVNLIYRSTDSFDALMLERLIHMLDNPALQIPSRNRSRKTLKQLKALAETMNHLERNTNFLLHQVLNGEGNVKNRDPLIAEAGYPEGDHRSPADLTSGNQGLQDDANVTQLKMESN